MQVGRQGEEETRRLGAPQMRISWSPCLFCFLAVAIQTPTPSAWAWGAGAVGAPGTDPATSNAPLDERAISSQRVMRFLENRIKDDPDDITALNRLSSEYIQRYRDSGDDRDLKRSLAIAEQSLKSVPAEQNTGGLA